MTQIIKRDAPQQVQAPLSELIHLKDTDFTLPKHATRELDPVHVVELSESDISTWPPIKAVETDEGLAVIDGYHRWHGLERKIKIQVLGLEDATPSAQKKALDTPLDDATQQKLEKQLEETTIVTDIGVYTSVKQVATDALTANLKHGLAPKGKARVEIALDLWDLTRGDTPEPTQADIARMVNISRATLNEYLKKREKEQEKLEAEKAIAEGKEPVEKTEVSEGEKAVKKAEKFIASLDKLFEEDTEAFNTIIHMLTPVVITNLADMHLERTDDDYTESIRKDLSITAEDLQPDSIKYISRLSLVLAQVVKKSTRKAKKAAPSPTKQTQPKAADATAPGAQNTDNVPSGD